VPLKYCERVLLFPPFEVWKKGSDVNLRAHLLDLYDSADAPRVASPATLEARRFNYRGASWVARLRSFRGGDMWRGHIALEDRSGSTFWTAFISREADPAELCDRFLSFESDALQAFVRSTPS
jgi:hypothetical protein